MSYEGYEQWLCKNGHLHEFDCYSEPDLHTWRCPDCGERCVWWYGVDQTNDEGVPAKLRRKTGAIVETCKHCGALKCIEQETYHIPLRQGRRVKEGE